MPPLEGVDDNWEKIMGGSPDHGGESDSGKDDGTEDEKTTGIDE